MRLIRFGEPGREKPGLLLGDGTRLDTSGVVLQVHYRPRRPQRRVGDAPEPIGSLRIDAHQHFWHYDPREYDWIGEDMGRLRRDFLPPDLEPEMRRAGFDGCIAVQARQSLEETRWLLDLADRHPFVRGVVGWVDLCAESARSWTVSEPTRASGACATSSSASPTIASCCAPSFAAAWPCWKDTVSPTISSSTPAT